MDSLHTSTAGHALPLPPKARWRRPSEPPRENVSSPAAAPVTDAAPLGAAFNLFCVLTFVVIGRPNDYFQFLVPLRLALVFTVLTAAVTLTQRTPSSYDPFKAKETKRYLLLFAVMVIGIPFAIFRPGAFEQVIMKYVVNVAYFLMFLVHVDSLPKLKRLAGIMLISIALFNVFGFMTGQFVGGRYFTGSRMFDPNDVAFVEVSLLGFALWVLVGRFGFLLKIIALATIGSGVLLTLYTASRGGLLGLTTFLVLFFVLKVSSVRKPFKFAVIAMLVTVALANQDKINIERYQTLGSLENDYNFAEGGRVDTWKRGFREFVESPLLGVGVTGFSKAVGEQRRDEGVPGKWMTAHNAYILVLTETGIVGAYAFLWLIVNALWTFNRLRRPGSLRDPELEALPGVLLIGFGAQLVAAMFLSQAYSMFFTLAFAFSGALSRIAAEAAVARQPSQTHAA